MGAPTTPGNSSVFPTLDVSHLQGNHCKPSPLASNLHPMAFFLTLSLTHVFLQKYLWGTDAEASPGLAQGALLSQLSPFSIFSSTSALTPSHWYSKERERGRKRGRKKGRKRRREGGTREREKGKERKKQKEEKFLTPLPFPFRLQGTCGMISHSLPLTFPPHPRPVTGFHPSLSLDLRVPEASGHTLAPLHLLPLQHLPPLPPFSEITSSLCFPISQKSFVTL